MPIIKSITAIGKPTMASIMDNVNTLAMGTDGLLIVAIKIIIIAVKRAVAPKSIP